jgi:hypothetical protein
MYVDGRDLEQLMERLAESREAIVQLLSARSVGVTTAPVEYGAEAEDAAPIARLAAVPEPGPPVTQGPTPMPSPVATPHSSIGPFGIPGPAALELALIYRQIADDGATAQEQARPIVAPESAVPDEPGFAARVPWTLPPGVGVSNAGAPEGGAVRVLPTVTVLPTAQHSDVTGVSGDGVVAALPTVGEPDAMAAGGNRVAARATVKGLRRATAATTGPRAMRRRLMAVALVAVGAVVLLTTVVSMLPALANVL